MWKKQTGKEVVVTIIIVLSALISLLQFLYNRSLWIDEAMLALNIIDRNSLELLKHLDYYQVAPVLFLQIEKLFSTVLPNTEYGLRFFPLICFWGAVYFFYRISKILLDNSYAIIMALSLFAFNSLFIHYSGELKQYMTDVFVGLCVFYFCIKNYKKKNNKYYVLGITGTIFVFLSNIAPIVLFTGGIYLIYDDWWVTKREKIISLLIVFCAWTAAFLLSYYFFIYKHPSEEFMIEFWVDKFLPYRSFIDSFHFINNRFDMLLGNLCSFNIILKYVLLVLFLTGLIILVKTKKIGVMILLFVPAATHLFLSALRLYPFGDRLVLYILPCVMILCSIGFGFVTEMLLRFNKRFVFLTFVPPIVFLSILLFSIELKEEEIKESIKYIEQNRTKNENVFIYNFPFSTIYYGGSYAFNYYENIGFVSFKADIIHKIMDRNKENEYMDELKSLHGKYWFLFSHVDEEDELFLIRQVESIGCKRMNEFSTKGSSTYLYDFGE